jgi:mRNA interferase RelE/StbE
MWSVTYTADAIKSLSRMDPRIAKQIRSKILGLARDPSALNNNIKRLTGVDGFRLRVGDWRAIYALRHQESTVVVIKVGHRSEVYE